MFDITTSDSNALNKDNFIYKEIAQLAALRKNSAVLKFGRMYMRKSSADGRTFRLPRTSDCLLAFSRILYDEEMVVVYNNSTLLEDEEYIGVDSRLNSKGSMFRYRYGGTGKVHVLKNENGSRHFIKMKLKPTQFAILTNQVKNR